MHITISEISLAGKLGQLVYTVFFRFKFRLRVVSNFGDGDCGAGKIHERAREISRRRDTKGFSALSTTRRDYSQSILSLNVDDYFKIRNKRTKLANNSLSSDKCPVYILDFDW